MGLGHFYTRRWLKGIVLFVVGGFLATVSYAMLFSMFDPGNTYSLAVDLLSTATFMGPWPAMLAWSMRSRRPKR